MSVRIVTDSTADLAEADARARGVDVVPLFVNFGDARFRDRVELSLDEFYRKLGSLTVLPTTAQPTPQSFEDAFRPHVERGDRVVCLTIMSSLSGTINAATTGARAFPEGAVTVWDSGTVAGGLALQVQHASDLADAGASVDEILAALEYDRREGRGFATIPDLSHAVRTGRVSRSQAFIGSLVKIVPVLRIDGGKVEQHARVRTFAKAQETMIEAAAAEANKGDGARVCMIHAHAQADAERIEARLRALITTRLAMFETLEAGPVLGTHAGQGAVGIFVIPALR